MLAWLRDGAAQPCADPEADRAASGDLHGLFRLGVASHSRRPLLHLEGAEADDLHFAVDLQAALHCTQDGADGALGVGLGAFHA